VGRADVGGDAFESSSRRGVVSTPVADEHLGDAVGVAWKRPPHRLGVLGSAPECTEPSVVVLVGTQVVERPFDAIVVAASHTHVGQQLQQVRQVGGAVVPGDRAGRTPAGQPGDQIADHRALQGGGPGRPQLRVLIGAVQ
jgi:hypothetical protein